MFIPCDPLLKKTIRNEDKDLCVRVYHCIFTVWKKNQKKSKCLTSDWLHDMEGYSL